MPLAVGRQWRHLETPRPRVSENRGVLSKRQWTMEVNNKRRWFFFARKMSVHSDRSTLSYKTRTKALRSGNHGPRVRTTGPDHHGFGPPRTGPEPPRARPGPLQVEAGPPGGLSHRASQGTRTQHPIWVGVRSPRKPLWARPPTPGSGATTCPTGPTS